MNKVKVRRDGRALWLTMADSENGNLLDDRMLLELLEPLETDSTEAEVVVLTSEGPVFSVGRPKNRPASTPSVSAASQDRRALPSKSLSMLARINSALLNWKGVSIAAVKGEAKGAATGFVVHCDVVLAEKNARFCFPEITYDLPPALVNSYLTKWLNPKGAHYLVLTGQEISADIAHAWGLVSEVLLAETLNERLRELVDMLVLRKAGALRACKETLLEYRSIPENEAANRGIDRVLRWLAGNG